MRNFGGNVAKKPEQDQDDKEQSQRFAETAEKLDVDKSGKYFSRAIGKLVPSNNSSQKKP
jgi:hypothetical protein